MAKTAQREGGEPGAPELGQSWERREDSSPTATHTTDIAALEALFLAEVEASLIAWLSTRDAYFERTRRFALDRFQEGLDVGRHLASRHPGQKLRVLDVGAGNGGVTFGMATVPGLEVTALDLFPNSVLRRVRACAGLPVAQVVGRGEALPFAAEVFDVVVCLDSFEHFTAPAVIGAEIMRVLRPGGVCLLKTPARLKYLFAPDPHCGLRGLLLLPDGVQRFLVNRVLGWSVPYDVHHTYWHVGEILEHFPGHAGVEALWNRPFPFGRWLWDRIWFKYRWFSWDGLEIRKAPTSAGVKTSPRWALPFPLAQVAAWWEEQPGP